MSIEKQLLARAESKCELCSSIEDLGVYAVPPEEDGGADKSILVCKTCREQLADESNIEANHWRCLNDSMWSEVEAVKVVAYRMLDKLKGEGWPQDLLDMMYLEDEVMAWARSGIEEVAESGVKHVDSNGVQLQNGDNVVVIKDLNVKGSSIVAKRGTAVRGIHLDRDNAEYIEGRVNGQQIVILTKYVKKS